VQGKLEDRATTSTAPGVANTTFANPDKRRNHKDSTRNGYVHSPYTPMAPNWKMALSALDGPFSKAETSNSTYRPKDAATSAVGLKYTMPNSMRFKKPSPHTSLPPRYVLQSLFVSTTQAAAGHPSVPGIKPRIRTTNPRSCQRPPVSGLGSLHHMVFLPLQYPW